MNFIDLQKQYQQYKHEIDLLVAEVVESALFINGEKGVELEGRLAEYVGVKHAVGVSSGTDALMVSLMALDVGPDREVITSPFTFIATAEVISMLRARPVFVDIDPVTYMIDPSKIEAAITNKTAAIIPVSLYGQCADFKSINAIADKYDIPVIEDGCQSFGAKAYGARSCSLSTIGCTSFFPSKPLGCYGDGGMIFADDATLAKTMREIRVHGQDRRYHHCRIGINARLDEIQAAVLLGKFPHFEKEVEMREAIGSAYTERLAGIRGLITPSTAEGNTHVFAQYSIQVEDREGFVAKLKGEGIPTAVHYPIPLHLQPAFLPLGYAKGSFPEAERVAHNIVSLPMHPFLDEEDINLIARIAKESVV